MHPPSNLVTDSRRSPGCQRFWDGGGEVLSQGLENSSISSYSLQHEKKTSAVRSNPCCVFSGEVGCSRDKGWQIFMGWGWRAPVWVLGACTPAPGILSRTGDTVPGENCLHVPQHMAAPGCSLCITSRPLSAFQTCTVAWWREGQ